jgi:hypothetical protein
MNRNITAFALGLFLRRRGAGAMIWSVFLLIATLLAAGPLPVSAAAPDTVLEWIGIMNTTVLAGGTNPLVSTRVVALVSASVFDAVNGIDPRFQPLHVRPAAPDNASERAAAIQAAYVILVDLYSAQSTTLKTQRDASLAALASTEKAQSIAAGVAWGQTVADAIWAWRLTDGIAPAPPPFLGVQSIAGTMAANAARIAQPVAWSARSGTAVRHDDAVGADTAIAIPLAAAPGARQSGVRS